MDGEKGGCGVEWGDVEMFLPKKFIISCVVCRAFLDQRRVAFFPPLWLPPLSFSTFPTLTAFCTFAPRRVFVLALGFLPFDWGAHGRGTTRRRPTISFSRLWGVGCIVYLPFCAMWLVSPTPRVPISLRVSPFCITIWFFSRGSRFRGGVPFHGWGVRC